MIANLLKLFILFIVIYFILKFVRFFILLLKTATANVNAANRNNSSINEKKKTRSDVIELDKDQYRVD